MLIRICLIIGILAGIGSVVVGLVKVKENIVKLQGDYADMTRDRDNERNRANKAEQNYANEQAKFKREQEAHTATKADLEKTTTDLKDAQRRNEALTADLDKEKAARTKAQQDLAAWVATGSSPEQIKAKFEELRQAQIKIEAIEAEKKVLFTKNRSLQRQIDELLKPTEDGERDIPLPPGLKGNVVTVDPKWDFVVLDIGSNQEAREGGVMLVNRNGKLVGKVRIRSLQPDRCIANVLPGWKLTDIKEGDQVLY